MKKTFSLLLCIVMFFSILPLRILGTTESEVNLLRTNLANASCVNMYTSDLSIENSNRFDENGALAGVIDGNTTQYWNVYGALDWSPSRYVGVVFSLNGIKACTEVKLYAGFSDLRESYRIYASDTIGNLYLDSSIIANDVVCSGKAVSVPLNSSIRYLAVFCTSYIGNQRIREIELLGQSDSIDSTPSSLSVHGNQIIDESGNALTLKGVNIPELSWSVYGDGSTSLGLSDADFSLKTAINTWGSSIIRLAVNPEYYLNGGTTKNITRTAKQYQDTVDRFITTATEKGVAVILDCHAYYGITDQVMQFWQTAASRYDENKLVLFGLLNEPVSDWAIYLEGGILQINGVDTTVYGISALLDSVRTISDNIAVIGGIDWAFDLTCLSSKGFSAFSMYRASAHGMTTEEYTQQYFVGTAERQGRGIVLDSHVYSHKPLNWDDYLLNAINEFPVILGEFGPTYTSAPLTSLSPKDQAYMNKIFSYISRNNLSFTAWGMNATPFLTTSDGTVTAFGKAVANYISDGISATEFSQNLIYTKFKSCRPIAVSDTTIITSDMFYKQAYSNGSSVGSDIALNLIDGDRDFHYDIYEWNNHPIGMECTLDNVYAGSTIKLTSGFSGYPDKYTIYASDSHGTLYTKNSIVEDHTTDFTGTVSFEIDRRIKYIAILASGYVRIKELELNGTYMGDLDNDGECNATDLTHLRKNLLNITNSKHKAVSDLNGDKITDIRDLVRMKKYLAGNIHFLS